MVLDDTQDVLGKQIAPEFTFRPFLFSRLGERLTWKTSTKHVVLGYVGLRDLSKIPRRTRREILLIQVTQRLIDFTGEDAPVP